LVSGSSSPISADAHQSQRFAVVLLCPTDFLNGRFEGGCWH
jgi:hypothetical protein